MALPDFSKFKAPYRFVPERGGFRLYEHGEKTRTSFKTMAEAKKKVLALNNAWRASPAGRKASPRKKYDAQGRIVRKPARRAARANPRPPMRRNFFGLFKSAPPLYRVTAYNHDGSTDVHTSASHAALEIALDEAGIKERAIPGLMDAASRKPLVDSSGDVFKRQKDAYGWYRVTIEMVGERPQAKSNPRKYDESKDGAGYRKLSDLKKGEFFKRKADARKVYRKGDYDRTDRKYAGEDESDISRTIYLKGDTMVYVGFDY
jgi:hypothetical protein